MSAVHHAIERIQARVLWSCEQRCIELIEVGAHKLNGQFSPFRYEVHVSGDTSLFQSTNPSIAVHYLEMLLGSDADGLEQLLA